MLNYMKYQVNLRVKTIMIIIFTHELHNMLILHLWKLDHHCYGYMINHIFYS